MANTQGAVLQEAGSVSIYVSFRVQGEYRAFARACAGLPDLTSRVASTDPSAALATAIAFSPEYWSRIQDKTPKGLRPFKHLHGTPGILPATDADCFLHVKSNRHDLNFELVRRFFETVETFTTVLEEIHGFTYQDTRDLTGFIDGTMNPKGEERTEVACIGNEDADFAGGSFVLTQRYVHNLKSWATLSTEDQERVIGRRKKDSAGLETTPPNAHIARAETHVNGVELKIVRHSQPYGTATGEKGLFFIAYAKDTFVFNAMLQRMMGLSGDGTHDRLMSFTKAVTGQYFFVPSLERLSALA